MLADLESLEKRRNGVEKKAKRRRQGSQAHARPDGAARWRCCATASRPASSKRIADEDEGLPRAATADLASRCSMSATSTRPSPPPATRMTKPVEDYAKQHRAPRVVVISAAIEASRPAARRRAGGIPRDARPRRARPRTTDPRGLRAAWPAAPISPPARRRRAPGPSTRATEAPQAAGVIHTDFERGFIRAQTIAYDDYVTLGGEVPAKEAGKARDEGKEYVVQDGDVMLFRFNT